MDFKTIILKKEKGIAAIILNCPERLNALVAKDDEIYILTGAGNAFCSRG